MQIRVRCARFSEFNVNYVKKNNVSFQLRQVAWRAECSRVSRGPGKLSSQPKIRPCQGMITIEKKYIYLFYLVNIKPKDGHKHRKVILSSIGNLQHWLSINFAAEGYNKWKDCVGKYVLPSVRPCSTAQSWSGKRCLSSTLQSSLKTLPISIRIQIPWDKTFSSKS